MSEHDPREDYDDEPWKGQLAPDHVVRWPASAMWVFGLVQLLATVLWFVFGIVLLVTGPRDGPAQWPDFFTDEVFRNLVGIGAAGVVANLVILRGAAGMHRFRRYPWAITAAVLTLFAVPCFYFAVIMTPFGVWALIVLCRRDVRARFAATASGRMNAPPPETTDARANRTA
jgi:hypothetical protein